MLLLIRMILLHLKRKKKYEKQHANSKLSFSTSNFINEKDVYKRCFYYYTLKFMILFLFVLFGKNISMEKLQWWSPTRKTTHTLKFRKNQIHKNICFRIFWKMLTNIYLYLYQLLWVCLCHKYVLML